NLVY
ncbi:unnamed protein product, partial [Callosobruchus maculatus]